MAEEAPAHKQPIESRLAVVFPSLSVLMRRKRAVKTLITRGEEELVAMEKRSWLSDRYLELHLPGYRRYRFDRPSDASSLDPLKSVLGGLLGSGPPKRRMVWRAGAGTAAQVTERSVSDEQLSARIRMEGETFEVTSDKIRAGERDRRLVGSSTIMATIEPAETALIYSPSRYHLTPRTPVRIDLLAIAVHTLFWMEEGMAARKPGGD